MNDLPVEQAWLTLVNLFNDLKDKGIETPKSFPKDLGLIKSQISFYKKDPSHPDMINEMARADMALSEIQGTLLELAEEYNEDYSAEWFDKLNRVNRGEKIYETPNIKSKFLINPPPGFSSGRITLKHPISEDRVQEIAEYEGLIIEFDDDLTIALYGDKAAVKKGLQELAPFFLE